MLPFSVHIKLIGHGCGSLSLLRQCMLGLGKSGDGDLADRKVI